ncbi:exosortase family protein XrtF [Flavobacterium sp. NST-5]|uniref:Exosortase family protein XrtF n=1 Tax=Flavobacterium ichthyis TaxID=2698827 RepID=A0ABW9Z4P1_9FLAO|nr:exosortase family protein XrtF [Flavobacterium ichthyis]
MKNYFIQYKPFFAFLLKFFGIYGLLAILYHLYLAQFPEIEPDGITKMVASQTEGLLNFFGQNSTTVIHERQPSVKLFLGDLYIARVVEGCNAVSVMILFAAFVVAFKGKIKSTILFILAGIVIIHLLNVSRIALLAVALKHYPEQEHLLHGVIFPLFIYGVVFMLWIFWVQKFSDHAKSS